MPLLSCMTGAQRLGNVLITGARFRREAALADSKKYRVGDYTIDAALFRITRGSEVVAVEPKVFDLLVYLIEHRGRVLSRDELFQKVWDGREVSDATLSNHIKSGRRALG